MQQLDTKLPEEWRDIEGYEGLYQVSSLGRVKSLPRGGRKGRVLSQSVSRGYPTVVLCKEQSTKTLTVHRLVALAFIDNPEHKPEVNHINGNKSDNQQRNLEWVTKSENAIHACRLGLRDLEKVRNARKRPVVRSDGAVFPSIVDAAAQSGVTSQNVWNVLNGWSKTTKGYSFRYLEETT